MEFSDAYISEFAVHFVGNKGTGQEFIQADKPVALSEGDNKILKDALLSRVSTDMERYSFTHPVSLNYNEVFNFCLAIFAEDAPFDKSAVNIAKHLYESTEHPKIKDGDIYICLFQNCDIDNKLVSAIGIYKTETKSNFLDVQRHGHDFSVLLRQGAEVNRLDKGCLVFPTNGENGFDVFLFDNNRGEEALFWKDKFLSVAPQANAYYQTNQFMNLTKQFIAKQILEQFDMEKTGQIDLLNKSVEYFRLNDDFDKTDFVETVLQDDKLINAFKQYEHTYSEMNDVDIPDKFGISTQAVKKQARIFKSVLKLDKNFHIYIHGNKELIEKGYDETLGKNYYKIYFDEES